MFQVSSFEKLVVKTFCCFLPLPLCKFWAKAWWPQQEKCYIPITHMHRLAVYVKKGFPFAWGLSLENSTDSYWCFRLALLHSVSYSCSPIDHLLRLYTQLFQMTNNLTQTDNFPTRIPDCESQSPALLDLLLFSDASICSFPH